MSKGYIIRGMEAADESIIQDGLTEVATDLSQLAHKYRMQNDTALLVIGMKLVAAQLETTLPASHIKVMHMIGECCEAHTIPVKHEEEPDRATVRADLERLVDQWHTDHDKK